ncbi:MAG: maleylacetoacetate isomerase [Hyphomicrobiales bacterium]
MMKLYGYFRSSAAYRVRIALNLKGVPHEHAFVHLLRDGGGQNSPEYRARNPQGLVPALELEGGDVLTQSLAIVEYLDEVYPDPPLLPDDSMARAEARSIAQAVACDIHPLNNLRVLQYLRHQMGQDKQAVDAWYRHWVAAGFTGIEKMIGADGFCVGDRATLADVCLLPQIFNARRYDVDLEPYPRIRRVEEVCGAIPAFAEAHPARQPDAE